MHISFYFYPSPHFLLIVSTPIRIFSTWRPSFPPWSARSHTYFPLSYPDSLHSHPDPRIPTPIPHIPTLFPSIPIIPTLIPCIPTLIFHISTILTLTTRIPTLIPRITIIPLIPFPDSPFRFLQIPNKFRT